jgi:hypothetical protein
LRASTAWSARRSGRIVGGGRAFFILPLRGRIDARKARGEVG